MTPFELSNQNLDRYGEAFMSVLRHKYEIMEKETGIKIEPRFVIDGRILVDYDETYDYFRKRGQSLSHFNPVIPLARN